MSDKPLFDLIADAYDATRGAPKWVVKQAFAWLVDETRLSSEAIVLDVGIGTGAMVAPLLEHTPWLIGVDVSRNMLQKLRDKVRRGALPPRANLVLADAHWLPFRESLFDMIMGSHVMPYLQREKFYGEVTRVLKPGGYIARIEYGFGSGRLMKLQSKFVELAWGRREIWKRKLARLLGDELTDFVRGRNPIRPRWHRRKIITWREPLSVAKFLHDMPSRSFCVGVAPAIRQRIVRAVTDFAEREFGLDYAEDAKFRLSVNLVRI